MTPPLVLLETACPVWSLWTCNKSAAHTFLKNSVMMEPLFTVVKAPQGGPRAFAKHTIKQFLKLQKQ